MKFGQVIEYNKINILLQKSWRLVPGISLFLKKVLYAQFRFFRKASGNNIFTAFCVSFFKKNVSHVVLY